ncbi:MAG: hypothetical protein ACT4OV_06185, partial [Microthrixaceae bacterium]
MRDSERFPLSSFTPAALVAPDGPPWLSARRATAAERLASAALPTVDEEVWRYSRIADLDLERFGPAAPESTFEHGDLGRARV